MTRRDAEMIEFTHMLKPQATEWKSYDGHKICRFMNFCIKAKNKQMVHNIQKAIRENLEERGLIYNPLLGWVSPSETDLEISGIKQIGRGYWAISDLIKFGLYNRVKAREAEESYTKEQKEIYKEELAEEDNQYMKQVIEDDTLPF